MQQFKLPDAHKIYLDMLNQIFEIEKKLERIQEPNSISRNLSKLKELFETELYSESACGLSYYNPIDEAYSETRTDCDASIAGGSTDNLVIIEVIKPIIRFKQGGFNHIVQRGVVVVQSQNS